jgi:spermidine synthase
MSRLRPVSGVENGRRVVRLGAVVQSMEAGRAAAADIWGAMIPERRVRRALILGLGAGTVAMLLRRRYGPIRILGVDCDAAMVGLARREFGLGRARNVAVVIADAFQFVRRARGRYDLVCVDLYRGGRMPAQVLSARFLRDVRRLLGPGGTATFNLFRTRRTGGQLRRLTTILALEKIIVAGGNVAAHCSAE